jgi:hypothetical protein
MSCVWRIHPKLGFPPSQYGPRVQLVTPTNVKEDEMGKRFTEIEKWGDPWYRRLSPLHKLAWQFFCDACDAAGVLDLDSELADFQIGDVVDWEGFLRVAGDRVERLESGKFWIVGFIGFQYGKLSEGCAGHNNVFRSLRKHNLESRVLTRVLTRVRSTHKDKDKDKDKTLTSKESSNKKHVDYFSLFWEIVHVKVGREGCRKHYERIVSEWAGEQDPHALLRQQWAAYALSSKGQSEYAWQPLAWLRDGHYLDDALSWEEKRNDDPTGNLALREKLRGPELVNGDTHDE